GRQWVAWDVNEGTKATIQALVDAGNATVLRQMLEKRLEFGTAGLRAAMGPGTVCMNDLVIIQTMQVQRIIGLAYLQDMYGIEAVQSRGIVLGYDHRQFGTLNSKQFAAYSAAVAVSRGIKVYLYEGFVATPLVRTTGTSQTEDPTESMIAQYFEAMKPLARFPHDNANPAYHIKVAYTAMHGVGLKFTTRSFETFNLPKFYPVEAQVQPDPDFPTVAFPNPEEGQGALKLAFETAAKFKWMGNETQKLRDEGKTVLFAFEEAIGFCVGNVVKDKDGDIPTSQLYATYGHFVTQNHYVKCYDPATIQSIFKRLRNEGHYWHAVGNYAIQSIRDLTTGFDSAQPDYSATLPVSATTEMITYSFVNGVVATLRTSGTEPKLKYYVESPGGAGLSRQQVTEALRVQVAAIVNEMLQPELNHLERP
ncbi:hypothetical protein DYB32_003454, partial [Aphanomyces invadans]